MDESWRMRMPHHSRPDFSDVFGGPPRTLAGSDFYEEIFRSPETAAPARRNGRSLRPFSIPACRWNWSTMMPAFNVTSPDLDRGINLSAADSSSSGLSSLWEDKPAFQDHTMQIQGHSDSDSDSDSDSYSDELMSSYVIEINSDHYNDDAINEAVAWAKDKYQQHTPPHMHSIPIIIKQDREQDKGTTEAKQPSQDDMGLKLMDKEVELWSSGKQGNIRLLLSSLHQILWPNSNWHAMGLTNLIQSSHVKKAYHKAQLCLHPDKLQQRGATPTQNYVAAKVFTILKDAWDAFVTQDVILISGR